MTEADQTKREKGFTVGICTTGSSTDVVTLANSILSEASQLPYDFRKLVVVASACPEEVVSSLRRIQENHQNMDLVVDESRYGKADAINRVLDRAQGEFVVLVNSDAIPAAGSLAKLLRAADSANVGAVSAMPITEPRNGMTATLVDLMWSTHNECSIALNHMNLSNHSCDEMVVFRTAAISKLPGNLVNDGAFLAATVRRRGYSVRVCASANVSIQTPTRISDLVRQRRRILFGHTQVWRKIGRPPKTVESLLLFSTPMGLNLLVRTLAKHPKFLFALPVAAVSELTASMLSIVDTARSSQIHAVWRRFA